jgi:hypothetical protein
MKNSNQLGVHVFEKTKEIPFETEVIGINLVSILTWKLFHGPIVLYCNSEYLKVLQKWGLDRLYDSINTELLDTKPQDIDYEKYWAFVKLLVIKDLKERVPFTLFDNDLWVTTNLNFDSDSDLIVYHKEDYQESYHNNIYVDMDLMLPESIKKMNFDKTILPTNAAILHFNNKYFIDEWVDLSKQIVDYNKDLNFKHKSTQMCFVEQRLLPMLLTKRGFKYSTFIDNIYVTHKSDPQDGSEWYPHLNDTKGEMWDKFQSIKHVWGLKKSFTNPHIKSLVMENVINTLRNFNFTNTPYQGLLDTLVKDLEFIRTTIS